MFNEKKVAQMAAYLLHKRGGAMAFLKLMKLLYLSDRKSMEMYGEPISGDYYCSMNKGPALSNTYSIISFGGDNEDGWAKWISAPRNYDVSLKRKLDDIFELEDLSKADIKAMDEVYAEYGHWNRFDLCEQTHRIYPEWQDPHGSSIPIKMKDIFMAIGYSDSDAEEMVGAIQEKSQLEILTSDLR